MGMDRARQKYAASRYKYWLESTTSKRLAANITNRELDLALTIKEYEALPAKKKPQPLKAEESDIE